VTGRIRSIEKSNDIENRTRDLPACSIVPQPTTLPRRPSNDWMIMNNVVKMMLKEVVVV
jgi:hypothetical protein